MPDLGERFIYVDRGAERVPEHRKPPGWNCRAAVPVPQPTSRTPGPGLADDDRLHHGGGVAGSGLLVALPYWQLSLANGPVAAGFARGEVAATFGCLVLTRSWSTGQLAARFTGSAVLAARFCELSNISYLAATDRAEQASNRDKGAVATAEV